MLFTHYTALNIDINASSQEFKLKNSIHELTKGSFDIVGFKTRRPTLSSAKAANGKALASNEAVHCSFLVLKTNGQETLRKIPLTDLLERSESMFLPYEVQGANIDWDSSYIYISNTTVRNTSATAGETYELAFFLVKNC